MDYDIPIVSGTPMPPPVTTTGPDGGYGVTYTATGQPQTGRPDLRTATATNGGRSSRFVLPTAGQENIPISSQTVRDLKDQGFTQGLAESLQTNKKAFPLSIWIIDNSGSMNQRDGHRFIETTNSSAVRVVECTRWAEMQQTVSYHVQLAALLQSPTVFRMLNDPGRVAGPQQFGIAENTSSANGSGGDDATTRISQQVAVAQQVMLNTTPGGVTPLIPHIQEVRQNILDMEHQLRADGSKVVLVLATDGLPTDERGISDRNIRQQFVQALRALEGLPIWIVVRLCTDEVSIFYHSSYSCYYFFCFLSAHWFVYVSTRGANNGRLTLFLFHFFSLFLSFFLSFFSSIDTGRTKLWTFGTISIINSN